MKTINLKIKEKHLFAYEFDRDGSTYPVCCGDSSKSIVEKSLNMANEFYRSQNTRISLSIVGECKAEIGDIVNITIVYCDGTTGVIDGIKVTSIGRVVTQNPITRKANGACYLLVAAGKKYFIIDGYIKPKGM